MEIIESKRGKRRKQKYRFINGYQRYDQIKYKVRSENSKIISACNMCKEKQNHFDETVNANAFWENYKAACEWRKTHNITWWKTKCFALEQENYILKENIKNLIQNKNTITTIYQNKNVNDAKILKTDNNIEFYLNEDMITFLTQSIQHKIELKNKEYQIANKKCFEHIVKHGYEWINERNEDAKLLYGKASSKVLAMETAVQTTIERHIDKLKPHFWPNIPLKF